jgi:hypothetical protein
MAWEKSSHTPEQQVPGALIVIRLHTTLEKQVLYSKIVHLFRHAVQPLGDFSGARLGFNGPAV